jgi:AraC-like DNA-binding protein
MDPLDLILRSMAATQLLFLALLLLRRSGSLPALRFAALLPLGLAAFAVTSARGVELGALGLPLTLLCVANPVWFWILAQALFDDGFRLTPRHFAVLAAVWTLGSWHELVLPFPPQGPVHWLFMAVVLCLIALALVHVLRGRRGDLVEERRRWRASFVAASALYGVVALALLTLFGGQLPTDLARIHIAFLFVAALAVSLALALPAAEDGSRGVQTRQRTAVVDEVASGVPAAPAWPRRHVGERAAPDEALLQSIRKSMEVDHLYRDEHLTVAGLARAIGSQEYLVRRAINGGLRYRNFSDFLHHYRLAEAAPRLLSQRHLPVLSIALDVGYGSIGPFNRAFRQRFGMAPTAYRSLPPSADPVTIATAAHGLCADRAPNPEAI